MVIETAGPYETLARVLDYLQLHACALAAVGVASFGPIDLDRGSATFGHITSTPKPGWRNTDIVGPIRDRLRLPVGFDTDVNGAALAEWHWGAAHGLDNFAYVTVGSGVGGGAMAGGRLIHGVMHPEMGHLRVPRFPTDPLDHGTCPFHDDCWEGWISRPAREARWGTAKQATDLARDELELLAYYIGSGLATITYVLSPQRLVLGGGVILGGGDAEHRELVLDLVRHEFAGSLNGYLQAGRLSDQLDTYIVAPALGADAGVLGGIALARAIATADSCC